MARTRVRLAVLAVAVSLAVAACGGGDSTSGGGGGGGNGNGNGGDLPECPIGAIDEAGEKPVNIVFWHSMTRANEDALEALTEEFNGSQPDVRVKLVNQTSYNDTLTKYRAGLGSGDLPDLVQIEDTGTQFMIDSRSALPVQACIDAEDYDLADYVERVVQYYSVEDVLWPMPFNVSNPVLYYDKALFRKAGLDPEKPPATLDEVREASQAIVDSGAAPHGIAMKVDAWILEQFLAKAGEQYVNNGNGREARATAVAYDTDTGLEIFQWWEAMVADDLALDTGYKEGNIDHYLAVGNGNAAMTIDTTAALGTISQVLGSGQFEGVDLGVGPMPGPEGEGGVLVGGAALYIVNKSAPAEQEAAWRFVQFLNEAENQADWSAATGYIPLRRSAAEMPAITQRWEEEPGYRVAYDQLVTGPENVATAGPVIGAYRDVRMAAVDALQAMLSQGLAPDEALDRAARDADAAIEEYNSRVGG